MKNPNKLVDVKDKEITEDMFLIDANRFIFMAMNYLYYKKQDPTPYAIMEVTTNNKMKKVIEDFGGVEYLDILLKSRTSENNLEIFCQKLKQAYTRRKLFEICQETEDFVLTDKAEVLNPNEILEKHESLLSEIGRASCRERV